MAITKLTIADIVQVTGLIGTVVATKYRRTTVIRRRYGKQAPSPAQIVMRHSFTIADDQWKYLSLADRRAWRDYRRWQHINGYAQFMRVNITRSRDGLPIIDNPANIP